MNKYKILKISILILVSLASNVFACNITKSIKNEMNNMKLLVDNVELEVDWEDNESVKQLSKIASNSEIVVNSHRYGGFEQVGELGFDIISNNKHITTEPGDIVLYNGNNIVIFFGTNGWSYTKLGKIKNKSISELKQLLDKKSVVVSIKN